MADALQSLPGERSAFTTRADRRVIEAFPDEVVADIAASLGVAIEKLTPGLAAWASWAAQRLPGPPLSPEVRDELRSLCGILDRAEDALLSLSADAKHRMRLAAAPGGDPFAMAARLSAAAAKAGGSVSANRGAKRDVAARRLTGRLADLFGELTGKPAVRSVDRDTYEEVGDFTRFAERCLPAIGAPEMATAAKIRAALTDRVARMERLGQETA